MGRRGLLAGGVGLAAALATPAWAEQDLTLATRFWQVPRTLHLRHANNETVRATYWSDGELVTDGYRELSWFMRDRIDDAGVYMQLPLFDILYGVHGWLSYFGIQRAVTFNSGYRTPRRNSQIEGAARNSEHIHGRASDITIQGISVQQIARFGAWLGGGGVGWYPNKNFVHLDCGRLREWRG